MNSRHTIRWCCVKCKGYVGFTDKHRNHGVCPCCGHESDDEAIVLCFREVGEWVKIRGWFLRSKLVWVPKKEIGDFKFPTGVTPP